MEIHPSARKHRIADEGIEHAMRPALAIDDQEEDTRLYLGAPRSADLLEVATAQRLGARALAEDDLDLGLLLARQGVALDDSVQTRGSLLAALLKSPAALGVLRGDGERMTNVVLSPDQRTLAAGNADNKVFWSCPVLEDT